MKLAVLAALEQRTALRCTMPGMTSSETAGYVAHHSGSPEVRTSCSPRTSSR
ncbi:type II secretory pathway predicted ATPase ExeA [Streptomyces aurantiacus]|uniref:hypothetical protein n=1 Tax=Streptomyces aurantiacus TaxID=47760 RepID=UPI002793F0F8|nr:hypothetical protein [Streptomyces aurantiacus]MDQ0779887.1 type II secretory pathway predicted ATPase ExeA [Streptomyces aurantiacus]